MTRTIFLVISIVGLLTTVSYGVSIGADTVNRNVGIIDGMVFIGHVGPKDGEANGEDEVVFQNGKFLSTSCSKYGFRSAPYSASQDGDRIVFKAITHSPEHGKINWEGQIVGNRIEATYLWTKERWYWFDANEENWFRGQIKNE